MTHKVYPEKSCVKIFTRGKRGVSTTVATVLVVLLAVLAVTILFTFIFPTVNDNLQSVVQENVELSISTSGGYTIWDQTNKLAKVQVKRGNDNTNLEGINFKFYKEDGSLDHTSTDIPSIGQVKTYSFILGDFGKPEGIKITANIRLDNGDVVEEVIPQGETELGNFFSSSNSDYKDGDSDDGDTTTASYIGPDCFNSTTGTICTCEDLQNMETNLSGDYVLQNNIDCSNTVNWNSGAGFVPVGDSTTYFSGNFDGQGYVVDSLYIDRSSENNIGLFGYLNGSTISNVGLTNVDITGRDYVGALFGTSYLGSFEDSYSTGSVSGRNFVGGLVGSNGGTLNKTYSSAKVSSSGNDVGGLVGGAGGIIVGGSLYNSYATGNVSGQDEVGGLVGSIGYAGIYDSYSTGDVSGLDNIGGIAGNAATASIQNSYSSGNVSGTGNVGGFVGFDGASISGSYWNILTSIDWYGDSNGYATDEVNPVEKAYFYNSSNEPLASWDTNIWTFSGSNHPTLAWQ